MSTMNTSRGTSESAPGTFTTETITRTVLPGTTTINAGETTTFNGTTSTYTTTYYSTYHSGNQSSASPTTIPTATPSLAPTTGGLGDFTRSEQIGMGVGVSVGGIAVIALIWFMVRKRRRGVIQLPTYEPQHQPEKPVSQSPTTRTTT